MKHQPLLAGVVNAALSLWVFETAAPVAVAQPVPITDLGTGLYLGQFQGGLYPGGSNTMPAAHAAEGLARAQAIQPLDVQGNPDPNGHYALLSLGMSNTTQEFCGGQDSTVVCSPLSFMGQASADALVNHDTLVIVNGAKSGKTAAFWDSPTDPDYDRVRDERLAAVGVTEAQVQAAWVKVANPRPSSSLPSANADAYRLVEQMGDIARALKVRYPNMQQVFFSSRIYAGYATTSTLNPEPYAYESGLAVKWVVEAQIEQMNGGGIDPLAGDLNYDTGIAPWIAWGPYLWADGLNPRSDGLIWERADLANDGTHPSMLGAEKVGAMMMDFFKTSPHAQSWFLASIPGDFNGDRIVDAADYVVWRKTDGTPQGYNAWRTNFGNTSGGGSSVGTAVPEPAVSSLLLIATIISMRLRGPRLR